MTLELKEPTLIKRIEQLASATHQPSEQLLETAVQKYLDELEREAIHRATEIFWGMYDDLVRQYPQEHVTMREGRVVDHDQNASLQRQISGTPGSFSFLSYPSFSYCPALRRAF